MIMIWEVIWGWSFLFGRKIGSTAQLEKEYSISQIMPMYSMNPQIMSIPGWWFQPIWKILHSQIGSFPQVRMKKTYLKPPPRFYFNLFFGLQNLHQLSSEPKMKVKGHQVILPIFGATFFVGGGNSENPQKVTDLAELPWKKKTHFIRSKTSVRHDIPKILQCWLEVALVRHRLT